jgi:hypothetical protein
MGLFDHRRRRQHAQSLDWRVLARTMTIRHELQHTANLSQARETCDAVTAVIGEQRIVQALIDCDYEMRHGDRDAVIARALAASGYLDVRQRLYGPPGPSR